MGRDHPMRSLPYQVTKTRFSGSIRYVGVRESFPFFDKASLFGFSVDEHCKHKQIACQVPDFVSIIRHRNLYDDPCVSRDKLVFCSYNYLVNVWHSCNLATEWIRRQTGKRRREGYRYRL